MTYILGVSLQGRTTPGGGGGLISSLTTHKRNLEIDASEIHTHDRVDRVSIDPLRWTFRKHDHRRYRLSFDNVRRFRKCSAPQLYREHPRYWKQKTEKHIPAGGGRFRPAIPAAIVSVRFRSLVFETLQNMAKSQSN